MSPATRFRHRPGRTAEHRGGIRVAAALLASAMAVTAMSASPAEAAAKTERCKPPSKTCILKAGHPKKGKVKVTANNKGSSVIQYQWVLTANGKHACGGFHRERDKPRSLTCHGVPEGKLKLQIGTGKGASLRVSW